jgi:hypothetical protein
MPGFLFVAPLRSAAFGRGAIAHAVIMTLAAAPSHDL